MTTIHACPYELTAGSRYDSCGHRRLVKAQAPSAKVRQDQDHYYSDESHKGTLDMYVVVALQPTQPQQSPRLFIDKVVIRGPSQPGLRPSRAVKALELSVRITVGDWGCLPRMHTVPSPVLRWQSSLQPQLHRLQAAYALCALV
jgi:hypothetical protein